MDSVRITRCEAERIVGRYELARMLESVPTGYSGELQCFPTGAKLCVKFEPKSKRSPHSFHLKGYHYAGDDLTPYLKQLRRA